MAGALQNSKVFAPRTDSLTVLVGHDPRDLVQMGQVMNRPSRQQFRESDDSEGRMSPAACEICLRQIQGTEFAQVLRPQASKFIQQLSQRFALALSCVSKTVKGVKRTTLAKVQHHPGSRHPIRALAVNEMADDIEGVPGIFTFIS